MSKIEDSVCSKILERAKIGKEKYGTTMERNDLSRLEWLIHCQEEAMDMVVYLEKLISLEESNSESSCTTSWDIPNDTVRFNYSWNHSIDGDD
jgi:hypothetical protein